jgi:hypothetical protein
LEYLSVWKEKQLRAGLSINILTPGKPCQAADMASFLGRPRKKRADDLLKLGRHQLKMAVAILTGHAAVRGHLRTMGLFNGEPTCRFCRMETNSAAYYLLLRGDG